MTVHTGPLEKTLPQTSGKKCCSKNLSRNEGSEGKREARISMVFKMTESSGVSTQPERFSSITASDITPLGTKPPCRLTVVIPAQASWFCTGQSQADLYKELSAHSLIHLVFLLFSPSTTCQEAGCKNLHVL